MTIATGLAVALVASVAGALGALRMRTAVGRVVVGAAIALGAVLAVGLLTAVGSRQHIKSGSAAAVEAQLLLRSGLFDEADSALLAAAAEFREADSALSSPLVAPLRLLPTIGRNVDAMAAGVDATADVLDVAITTLRAADPAGWRLVDGRFPTDRVLAAHDDLEALDTRIRDARRIIAESRAGVVEPVATRLDALADRLDGAAADVTSARMVVESVPRLFGHEGARRYLVGFLASAEARAGGGIMGTYAVLDVVDGRLRMVEFGQGSDLNPGLGEVVSPVGPAEYQERWGGFEPERYFQNVTLSPHFPHVGAAALDRFEAARGTRPDGVISLDPTALTHLLYLTGPVDVTDLPQPLNGGWSKRLLEHDQYVSFDTKDERTGMLRRAAEATFAALLSRPVGSLQHVATTLGPAVETGHVAVYFERQDEQLLAERFRADGSIAPYEDDFVGVYLQNGSGNKIDVFTSRTIDYDVHRSVSATTASLRVSMNNASPSAGLPRYVNGNTIGLPVGTNRSFSTFYTGLEPVSASVNGVAVEISPRRSLGRWTFDVSHTMGPGDEAVVEIELAGPGRDHAYDVVVGNQNLPNATVISVTIDGKPIAQAVALDGAASFTSRT